MYLLLEKQIVPTFGKIQSDKMMGWGKARVNEKNGMQ
jgi:hypothetical protein